MDKKYKKALFVFRRDLRLEDNTALLFALQQAQVVITSFIFTPEQIEKNSYKSDSCLQFMIESLEDLREQLEEKKGKLYLFWGRPDEIVEKCIFKLQIDLVTFNRDYTPYSLKRDRKIEEVCKKNKIAFQSFDDALLQKPSEATKADGKPYVVFTPYYKMVSRLPVASPKRNREGHYFSGIIAFAEPKSFLDQILPKRKAQFSGGRKEGLKILQKDVSSYPALRDFPAQDSTTHISAHLKFTTCSIREVYEAWRSSIPLIRSLFWRDFFTLITYFFPELLEERKAFRPEFDQIKWRYDQKLFERWCEGTTGFPIVDAGMRELKETGFMHNRLRMITASFLVKDLHIDWRLGEKYFAKHLIDYDPAVNNGNWQWVASTGCDSQPYFRIFNPWSQQKKFDPEAEYISRWVPELAFLPPKTIHSWEFENFSSKKTYPAPMVDHSVEAKKALHMYRSV